MPSKSFASWIHFVIGISYKLTCTLRKGTHNWFDLILAWPISLVAERAMGHIFNRLICLSIDCFFGCINRSTISLCTQWHRLIWPVRHYGDINFRLLIVLTNWWSVSWLCQPFNQHILFKIVWKRKKHLFSIQPLFLSV